MARGAKSSSGPACVTSALFGVAFSVLVCVGSSAQAQDAAPGTAEPTPAGLQFSFSQTPFAEVLELFAAESALPVIYEAAAPGGSLTFISAESYSFEDALEILNLNLRMHNVQLRRRENFLYLTSIADAARRPTPVLDAADADTLDPSEFVTVTIPLNNAIAATVAEQIQPLVAEPGAITAIPQQNLLVVVETASQITRIRELVQRIDAVPPTDSAFRIFSLTYADSSRLLTTLRGLVPEYRRIMQIDKNGNPRLVDDVSRPPLRLNVDRRLNAVVAVGPPDSVALVEELVQMLDSAQALGSGDSARRMMTFTLATITARDGVGRLNALFAGLPAASRPTLIALDDVGKITAVGSSEQLVQARALLAEIDDGFSGASQDATAERTATTLPLDHLDPAQAIQLAGRLLTPRQQQVVRMTPSPSGRGLVVVGPGGDVDAFAQLLNGLDVAPRFDREVRTLVVTGENAQEDIRRAGELDDLTDAAQSDPVTVRFDAADARLTLIGSRQAIARFEARLTEVRDSAVVRTVSRQYTIERSEPSDIATRLARLAEPLLRPEDGGAFVAPVFEPLDELDRLVVRAQGEQFGVIEELIDRLESDAPVDRQVRMVRLTGPDPDALVRRAQSIDAELRANRADADAVETEFDSVSGMLVIRGAASDVDRFSDALGQAQQLMPPARSSRLVEIRNREASDILGPLNEYLQSADSIDAARRVPAPEIRVIDETNALLVTAEDAQHRMIAEYVRRLDVIEPASRPPLRLLQLRTADASAIAGMLNQQYASRPQADRIARPVEVRADGQTNTLIVSAHEELFPDIRGFVDELNEDDDQPERITFLFPLRVARAIDVANAMDRLYPEPPMPRDRFNRPMPWLQEPKAVTVSADPSSNSLIIDAPADRRQSLEELAQRLDRVELPPVAELRTYRVVGADLDAVANTLRGLARNGSLQGPAQPGQAQVQVVIETEPESGTLIVAGDDETFTKVERVLESLGSVPVERGLRIVPIANADAAQVRERALAIYTAQVAQIPGAGEVQVSVNAETNSLELVADEEAMQRFLGVLEELQRQIGPARDLRLIELRFAQAEDVVELLRDLATSSESLRRSGGPEPVFETIEVTNSLMVAAQPDQFAIIEQLVRGLDDQQTAERPPLRIMRLRSTDASGLASVLDRSYRSRPAEDRARRPVDIQADAATNTLIVSAHPDILPEIEAIVNELNDTRSLDAEGREIRIFPLRFARADELARTIDQMFPDPPVPVDRWGRPMPQLRGNREITVRADRSTNSLIVDAPAQRMAGFEQIVRNLDQQRPDAETEVRTYRVRHADLDAVARTLTDLAGRGALSELGRAPVSVSIEPKSRTLIVSGPSAAFERVETVLSEIDGAPDRPATLMRVYPLEHARATRLRDMLERLLLARLREMPAAEGEREELLELAADAASNSLILSAPPEVHEAAVQLLEALDTEASAAGRATVRIVPLTFANARELSGTVREAMDGLDLSGAPLSVAAAAGANALLLMGSPSDLETLAGVIEPLDQQPFDADAVAVEAFSLQHARAEALAERLRVMLAAAPEEPQWLLFERIRRSAGRYEAPPETVVTAEPRNNTIVITGPGSAIELARTVIARLDVEAQDDRELLTFVPQRSEPSQLAQRAARFATNVMGSRADRVEFLADPGTRGIVVVGDPDAVPVAVELLATLDDRSVVQPSTELRAFTLQNISADSGAATLRGMLNDRSRWPDDLRALERAGTEVADPAVQADDASNRVLVSAPAGIMPLAETLLATLDQPAASQALQVRVFRLTRGDAESAADALRAALSAGQSPAAPQPTVTPEPVSGSLVVAATADGMARAAEIVEALDVTVEPDGIGVRTVFLRQARAEAIAPVVERALQRPSAISMMPWWAVGDFVRRNPEAVRAEVQVSPEPRLNAVVISGPVAVLELAEQVIAELESGAASAGATARALRVITLRNADATEVEQAVAAMFADDTAGPAPVVRVDRGSNSLIVRAAPDQIDDIESLASTLDNATLDVGRELRTIRVDRSRVSASEMAETLRRVLEDQGGLTVEVIDADDLVAPGDAGEPGAMGPTTEVLFTLARMAIAELWLGAQPAAQPQDQPASDHDAGEPDVTIAIDPATNSLVVIGAPRVADRIEALSRELAAEFPAQPTHVRVINLPAASDANTIASLLNQTVRQIGRASDDNPGGFSGRVSVLVDRPGNALIVIANDTDFASVRSVIAGLSRADRVADLTIKVYPLQTVNGRQAAVSLRDFLSPNPRGRQAQRVRAFELSLADPDGGDPITGQLEPGEVTVSSNPSGTSLIVSAPADVLPLVDRFVGLIDQSPVADRLAIRRYTLENAQASSLSRTLQSLFDAQRQGPGARDLPRARFIADDRTNALLVTASDEQHREIQGLLVTADESAERADLQTAVLTIRQARPSAIRQVVESVFVGRNTARESEFSVTAQDDAGLLVVRAGADDLAEVRALVEQIDTSEAGTFPVRTISLERADASEVARSLQQFFRERGGLSRQRGRSGAGGAAITGDRRSGTLVIAASDDDYEQLASLAAQFDAPSDARALQFKVIPLANARASDVQGTLQDMVWSLESERIWGRNAQNASPDRVFVESNDRTNSVVLFGQGDTFEAFERLIAELDQPMNEQGLMQVRAIAAPGADVAALGRIIEQVTATPGHQWWMGPDTGQVQAEPDRQRGVLMLIGDEESVERAAQYVRDIIDAPMVEGRVTRTFPLEHARASGAAANLRRFFADRARSSGSGPARVTAVGSNDGNVLIVSGLEQDLAEVAELIAQIDRPEVEGENRELAVFSLANADPLETSRTLTSLFPGGRNAAERVIVTPQRSTGSLIVSAPRSDMEEVRSLIERLDRGFGEDGSERIVTVPLEAARAEALASELSAALPSDLDVRITPVARTNALIVTGDDASISLVLEQIQALDTELERSPVEFRRFSLTHGIASDVAYSLRQLLRGRPRAAGVPSASIDASFTENVISVTATSDEMRFIEEMIEDLDTPPEKVRRTEFVRLRFADAEQIAEALRVFFGRTAPEARTPDEQRVTIVADPASNSLVISADESAWDDVRQLIDTLDSEEYDTSRRLRVLPLTHASAASVTRALNEGFRSGLDAQIARDRAREAGGRNGGNDRDSRGAPAVLVDTQQVPSVSAELETNSLIVFASPQDLERIEQIVRQLDVSDAVRLAEPRIIPVTEGRATAMAETLRQLYTQNAGRDAGVRRVQIVGDDASDTIVVRAEDDQFEQILALAEQLQARATTALPQPRVIRLSNVPAARLSGTVQDTFGPLARQRGEEVVVRVARDQNALVVTASETMLDQIERLVTDLDTIPGFGADAGVGDADAGVGDADANRAVAGGANGAEPAPSTVVPTPGVGQAVRVVPVEHNDPDEVRRAIEAMGVTGPQPADRPGVVSEPVRLVTLVDRGAIAVVAAPLDGPVVEALIRAIDQPPGGEAQSVRVVPLSLADANDLVSVLGRLLDPDEQQAGTGAAEGLAEQVRRLRVAQGAVGPMELDLAVPIRLIPNASANAVIVASTEGNVSAVVSLVEMLDTLPLGDAIVVRIFPLENAAAVGVRTIVQDLFRQGDELRRLPGTDRRGIPQSVTGRALSGELAVSVDERTNALVVAGREEAVALVSVLISDLDADDSERGWLDAQVIPLIHADPVRLGDTLRAVLVDGLGETPEAVGLRQQVGRLRVSMGAAPVESDLFAPLSGLVIQAEETLPALIVVGTPTNLGVVRELVRLLDVEAASASASVRIVPLEFASADRVAAVLRDVFDQRERRGVLRPDDGLVVTVDSRTNSLVVSTSPRSFEVVSSMLDTLDREETRFAVGLHVIPVPGTDAQRLAPRVERLMTERIQAARRAGDPESPEDAFSVEPDPSGELLIVAASDENAELVRSLITELTEGVAADSERTVTDLIAVRGGRAQEIADTIEEIYIRRENERRGDGSVTVSANDRLNALVVSGSAEDIERIRGLVEQLDLAEITPVREVRRIELRSANAFEVVQILEDILVGTGSRGAAGQQATRLRFFRQRVADEMGIEPGDESAEAAIDSAIRAQVSFTENLRTNSVLVAAPPEIMTLITEIIADLDSTTRGDRRIEIFQLSNADAGQLAAVLARLFNLTQQGDRLVLVPTGRAPEEDPGDIPRVTPVPAERQELSVTTDARTNSILVSATEEYMALVGSVIAQLDSVQANEREQIVYRLRNAQADSVAETLREYFEGEARRVQSTLGAQAGALSRVLEQEVTIVGDPTSNKVLVSASPRYIDTVERIISELDAAPPQVMIQVLLAEVTLDQSSQWGVDLNVGRNIDVSNIGGDGYVFDALGAGTGIATALGVPNFSVLSQDFSLVIRALEVQGKLEVLSRPQVIVNNNERGFILVGEDVAIVDGVERRENSTDVNVIRRNVGIELEVTPSISADGFVRMDVRPQISSVSSRTTQIGDGVEAPIIPERRVETVVTVKDGQTIVLGGLIQTSTEGRNTRTPFLGDLPLFGGLFRSDDQTELKTELLVMLTPHVIPGESPWGERRQRELSEREVGRMTDSDSIIDAIGSENALPMAPQEGPPAPLPDLGSLRPRGLNEVFRPSESEEGQP